MRRSVVMSGILLAAAGGIAQGQELGSRIGPAPAYVPEGKMNDNDRARATTNAYAECLLKRNPRGVERAAALAPDGPSGAAFARIAVSACLYGAQLTMPRSLLRGAAFVALYRRDYGRGEFALAPTAPDYASDTSASGDVSRQATALRVYASFVIRRDKEDSRDFVLAPVASKRERNAISALTPNLNACLSTGASLRFTKAVLQGVLAETLYRETYRAANSQAGNN